MQQHWWSGCILWPGILWPGNLAFSECQNVFSLPPHKPPAHQEVDFGRTFRILMSQQQAQILGCTSLLGCRSGAVFSEHKFEESQGCVRLGKGDSNVVCMQGMEIHPHFTPEPWPAHLAPHPHLLPNCPCCHSSIAWLNCQQTCAASSHFH